ncbi:MULTISPECIES: hypothetical protein [unclassified Nocardiopsis]|uniref:hypothetical protein n=1 Tax=unclassified Nocardiopsis TaxID=2649073 RepID=UPI0013569E5F|nr:MULTISPECIES: hypothetical protein [unclassified Nocardiopsis]
MPEPAEHPLPRNPYRSLVLLSFLALSGSRPAHGLLEQAHRLVTGALPHGRLHPRPRAYPRVRRRVLRRSLRPHRWHPRGGTGLRVSPAEGAGAEARALAALAGLDAEARAAYGLLRVEGLSPREATGLLASAGAHDAIGATERARAVPAEHRLPDPTLVRVNGRGSLLDRRALSGTAVLAGLAVLAAGLGTADPGGGRSSLAAPVALAPAPAEDVWRERFRLDLTAWHPRGGAVGDDRLVRRALDLWSRRGATGEGPDRNAAVTSAAGEEALAAPRAPRLVFAGQVGGQDVVVFHDAPWAARYTADASGERVEVFAEPVAGAANWPALRLADTEEGTHYLLPPWVTEADTAPLGGDEPDWREVEHTDGVTAALPTGEHCGVGPLLRLRAPEVAHGQPYTALDLGGPDTAHLGYMPPPPSEIRRLGPHEVLDGDSGFDLWGLVACAGPPPAGPVGTATAWEFARQELPDGGTGRWVCVRYGGHDGGGLARTVLVTAAGEDTDTVVAGGHAGGWGCSNLNRQVAAGTWWRDGDGRWHYLAAASREADRITVRGGANGSAEDGEPLAVAGPRGEAPPAEAVELSAVDVRGEEMTVLAR